MKKSFVKKLQELVDYHPTAQYKRTIKYCRKIEKRMTEKAENGHTNLTISVDPSEDVDTNLIVTYFNSRGIIAGAQNFKWFTKIKFSWERH